MATATPTVVRLTDNAVQFQWTLTSTDTDGAPIHQRWADFADRAVEIKGVFDTGTVVIEGANDTTTPVYSNLTDPQGNAIGKTSNGFEQILEQAALMRPRAIGANSSAALTVTILARRTPRGK